MKRQPFNRSVALELACVGFAVSAGCILVALFLGRDLNWDYFNYHDYAALSSLQDRLREDFFAAGYQGYLNPLPFYLFGWMLSLDIHSALIGSVIAFIQSANLFFLYLISKDLVERSGWSGKAICVSLTLLGAMSGVFLAQLGSSFVDPLTTIPVMAAIWLVLRTCELRWLCVACFLAGCSVALKLTNVVFAVGVISAAMISIKPRSFLGFWRSVFYCGLSGVIGFISLYSVWGWKLWVEYDSPFFPLFNNVFRSEWFPAEAIAYHRFIPGNLGEALLLPFDMLGLKSWVYAEIAAPDVRPFALMIIALAIFFMASIRSLISRLPKRSILILPSDMVRSRLIEYKFWVFFCSAVLLWLATSSNGRYATPLVLIIGPGLYLLLNRLVPFRYAVLGITILSVTQLHLVISAGNPRYNPMQWTSVWLPSNVPAELTVDPILVLSIGSSSESYLARYLHPGSAFVNPVGLISIPNSGAQWERFLELRQKYADEIYVVFGLDNSSGAKDSLEPSLVERYSIAADRLGVGFVSDRCGVMSFNELDGSELIFNDFLSAPIPRRLVYCKASVITPSEALASKRALAERIMNAYEQRCPEYFKPSSPPVEGGDHLWTRLYGKYDLTMGVNFRTREIYYYQERQAVDSLIGSVETWKFDSAKFLCALPFGGRRDITTLNSHAID